MANELIIIVEDNPKNLKLVRDTLQVKGYQTIEVGTPREPHDEAASRSYRPVSDLSRVVKIPVLRCTASQDINRARRYVGPSPAGIQRRDDERPR